MPSRTYAALFPYPLSAESRRSNGVLQVVRAAVVAAENDFDRRVVLVARDMGGVIGDLFGSATEVVELEAPRLYLRRRDARRPGEAATTMARAAVGLDRALRSIRPSVLHVAASSTAPLLPVAAWRRVPVVLHIQERGENLPARLYRLVNAAVRAATARIIVPASFLLESHPGATLIPNPIPPDMLGRRPVEKADEPRAVFTGVIARRKGIHHIIEALPQLLNRIPGARLDIVGAPHPEDLDGPPYLAELERRSRELGVAGAIDWWGSVDDPFPTMSRAWVGVIAGDRDIAPLVALETAAARTALVVASHGGIRDVLGPDDACWVAPGDVPGIGGAMSQVLSDQGRRDALALRGQAAAEATVPKFASQLRAVLAEVTA